MGTTIFALLVLSGAALYFMSPETRVQLARSALAALKAALRGAIHPAPPTARFDIFLRTRTKRAIVMPLLVAANVFIFIRMLFDPGALSDPQTLIAWGANYAPLTTNGEWWRLAASTFVHGGMFHLLITMAGLLPAGLILERAVGRIAFAATYFAAGVLASLVSLWTAPPMGISYGASGAVWGIYGLFVATTILWFFNPPEEPAPLPMATAKKLGAAAALFLLYSLATDHLTAPAELAGFGVGLAAGFLIARGVAAEAPPLPRTAVFAAAAGVVAIVSALSLRGVTDARPGIAQIAVIESRTAGAYDKAVGQFRLGRIPAKDLVQLIDRTIIPDLQVQRIKVSGLRGVPREQAPLVEAAEQYFQLREQSWRRRAEGLLRSNTGILREADLKERAALTAFEKIRPTPATD